MEAELPPTIVNRDPKGRLAIFGAGDIYFSAPGSALILRSPDGNTCKRVTIDNAGNLIVTSVACPSDGTGEPG